MSSDARIINLETSITTSDDYWPGKGIHYLMHPENLPCITAAGIDCCAVTNNHILDWGYKGLAETIKVLHEAGLHVAGAGHDMQEAQTPGLMEISGKGRVIVFALGSESSGIPYKWAAGPDKPGINMLPDLSDKSIERIAEDISSTRRPGDIIVASIHWGGNWGYEIPGEQIHFAHELIDKADVDVIHGHSSHHFLGIEIYKDKPVIYGYGDFLNDYEGIGGNEEYRSDLALMYFVRMDVATGKLMDLEMVPMQIRHFSLNYVSGDDIKWILDRLNRECNKLGSRADISEGKTITISW